MFVPKTEVLDISLNPKETYINPPFVKVSINTIHVRLLLPNNSYNKISS